MDHLCAVLDEIHPTVNILPTETVAVDIQASYIINKHDINIVIIIPMGTDHREHALKNNLIHTF